MCTYVQRYMHAHYYVVYYIFFPLSLRVRITNSQTMMRYRPPPLNRLRLPSHRLSNASKIYVTDLISKSVFHCIIIIMIIIIIISQWYYIILHGKHTPAAAAAFRYYFLIINYYYYVWLRMKTSHVRISRGRGRGEWRREQTRLLNYVHRPFRALLFIHVRFLSRRPVPLPRHDNNIIAVTSTHYITLRMGLL